MTTLNLIYSPKSDIGFKAMVFPDGQPHLKLDMASIAAMDLKAPVRILTRVANSNDLVLVMMAKNTLDHLGFERVTLDISYLMAARMDRVMNEGEPFSLKVVAVMINSGGFKRVNIFDPHSEVATAVIDRSYAVTNHEFVKDAIHDHLAKHPHETYALVSPDAGALKKIYKLAQYLDAPHVIECYKERDLKTGALSGFKTATEHINDKTTCIIVDDLCDGGGTFAGTAKMLREKGATKIVLVVSHGIFSKGVVIEGIDEVYTTDSYKEVAGVNCLAVGRYMG